MQMIFRPKFPPGETRAPLASKETPKRRIARRLAQPIPTQAGPDPHIAPTPWLAEPPTGAVYVPGPVLAYDAERGVILYRDGPPSAWRGGRDRPPPRRAVPPPAWSLWLQGALLIAAIVLGGVVRWRFGA